jgi:hypothetical protein
VRQVNRDELIWQITQALHTLPAHVRADICLQGAGTAADGGQSPGGARRRPRAAPIRSLDQRAGGSALPSPP